MTSVLRSSVRIALLAGMLSSSAAALAQSGPREGARITPAQSQKIFPEQKRLAISDHQARIAIIQQGERCLQSAASSEALRSCMKEQRNAMQRQREQYRSAMKALLERNGITLPERGKGEGRWREGRPGGASSI